MGLHGPLSSFVNIIPKSGIAVDAGAHVGYLSYWMSWRVDRVHAFEPQPEVAARLRELKVKKISVHQVALSNKHGEAVLRIPRERTTRASLEDSPDALGDEVTVPTAPLDSFELRDVTFIKIDVEGHESAVIEGAMETINRCRPIIFCEIEERHSPGSVYQIVSRFSGIGYQSKFWKMGKIYPFDNFDVERDQTAFLPNVNSQKYVNNFLFTPGPS